MSDVAPALPVSRLAEYVTQFHHVYGLPHLDTLVVDVPQRKMRTSLILEEADEFAEALSAQDLVGVADALGDLAYVAYGAALTHGFSVLTSDLHPLLAYPEKVPAPAAPSLLVSDSQYWQCQVHIAAETYRDVEEEGDAQRMEDAISHLIYTSYAAARAFGIDLDAVLDAIQASNLSKLDANGEVIRRADGKILKGPNFITPEPRIAEILVSAGWAQQQA